MSPADTPHESAHPFRAVGTFVCGVVVFMSLWLVSDEPAGMQGSVSTIAPLVLAAAALLAFWRKRASPRLALILLLVAMGVQAFAIGGGSFAATMLGVMVAVPALLIARLLIVVPLRVRRHSRWSTDATVFTPYDFDASWPSVVRERVSALVALGFEPRLMHLRSEGNVAAAIAVLAHARGNAFAIVNHLAVGAHSFTGMRLSPWPLAPEAVLSIVDRAPPDPFPLDGNRRVLLFPDVPASTLWSVLQQLHPGSTTATPPSADELAHSLRTSAQAREHWLVEHGYLERAIVDGERRYTRKGAFLSVLRLSAPGRRLDAARLARTGQDALRRA